MKPLLILFLQLTLVLNLVAQEAVLAHETFTIESKILNETRVINVLLPTDYSSTSVNYPVLYMPDGGVNEDFPHLAKTLDSLISIKQIPPMILVGFENTQRRRDLTGPTVVESDKKIAPVVGGSEAFRQFLKEELFAEIQKRYRITEKRGIIGESLAGLFIVETMLLDPSMFNDYIAIDPSLWWNKHQLVDQSAEYLKQIPNNLYVRCWFASSNAKDIWKNTKSFAKICNASKLTTFNFTYVPMPKETHSSIYRASKVEALLWMYGELK